MDVDCKTMCEFLAQKQTIAVVVQVHMKGDNFIVNLQKLKKKNC